MKLMKFFGTKPGLPRYGANRWAPLMHDPDYLQTLAARHRKFARTFQHVAIRERLQSFADDLEDRVRELQQASLALPAGEYQALN